MYHLFQIKLCLSFSERHQHIEQDSLDLKGLQVPCNLLQLQLRCRSQEYQVSVFTGIKISDLILGIVASCLPLSTSFLNILFDTNDEMFMPFLFLGSRQTKSGLIQRYEKIMKHVAYVRVVLAS